MKRFLLLFVSVIAFGTLMSQTMIPLPNHSNIYSGSARGYWFTAPTDFVITGLRVASTAGSGAQYIHLMKMASAPPAYPTSTPPPTGADAIWINGATNGVIQQVSFPVSAGDVICILGTAGTANSYAPGAFPSNVNGFPITLTRFIYQGQLTNGPATAVSQEVGSGSVSRVEIWWELPVTAPNDAGVTAIDSPSTFCEGTKNIIATIKNFGTNQINGVTVNWSINSVVQTPVLHNSLLDTANGLLPQTAQVLLGTNFFGAGVTDVIEAWTTNPNSVTDTVTANDSAVASLQPSLAGNFTIDPAGTGLTNYTTIAAAVADLNAFGVCGPATFAVAAGTYNEQMDLGKVEGASATNSITFTADTGGVIIEYGATGSADNFVLKMNKTEWVTLDGFTFQNATGGSTSYRALVSFDGGSSNNTLMNNIFQGYATTSSSSNLRGWTTNSAGNDYNKFMNNEFLNGGYYGFYFRGSNTSSYNVGNEFDGNLFSGGSQYATYFYYGADMKFNNNTIVPGGTSTFTGYGFYAYYQYGHTEAIGNKIDYRYNAMRCYYWYGDENNRNIIANNMIHSGIGTYTVYGLYIYGNEYTDIVHNTIWANAGASSTNYALYHSQGSKNVVANNSVFRPTGSSNTYGIYIGTAQGVTTVDNNNVWAPTGNHGYFNGVKADLTAWHATGGAIGTNGFDADPGYMNKDSMYTCNDTLDNAGMPMENVMYDFDGDNRDPSTPDIGADEFIGSDSSSFSAGPDGLLCNGNTIEIGAQVSGADYIWSNGGTTGVIQVSVEGTYTVSVISACGGSFTDEVEVVDNTPFASFTSVDNFLTGVFTNTSKRGDDYRWVFYDDPAMAINPMDTIWQESPIYLFPENKTYWVCLTNYNDCDTVETCGSIRLKVGIDENNLENVISLMPNPVSENLTIQFNGLESDQVNVEMTNVQGQAVYSNQYVGISTNANRTVDVSNLKKGMYIMKFTTENQVSTKRIIVQ